MELTAATGSVKLPLALATVMMFFSGLVSSPKSGITTTLVCARTVSGANRSNMPMVVNHSIFNSHAERVILITKDVVAFHLAIAKNNFFIIVSRSGVYLAITFSNLF